MRFNRSLIFLLMALIGLNISCELTTDEDPTKVFKALEEDEKSITQHFLDYDDDFSILNAILDTTGLDNLFRTYGDYTFLAPTNTAFENYFVKEGTSGYTDYTVEELTDLMKYHIFERGLLSGTFSEGLIEALTLSKNYMVSGPSADGSDILFNKASRMSGKDWIAANGLIHTVDAVIEKPTMNMYEWLASSGDYTIFVEGLDQTGLTAFAQQLLNENGQKSFYTLFVTPDSIYDKKSIGSFDDLANFVAPEETVYNTDSSQLRAFIQSHFMSEILSTSDATDDQVFYGTEGGATIKFGLIPGTANLVLNYETIDFPDGLAVNEFYSNNLTTNGIIHLMDSVYQVTSSFQRIYRSFIYLDVPGFPFDSLMDWTTYLVEELGIRPKGGTDDNTDQDEYNQQWPRPDVSDHLPFGCFGDWLTLNSPYAGLIKADFHRFDDFTDDFRPDYNLSTYNPMFFTWEPCDDLLDITRKLPYIIPGRYKLIIDVKKGSNRPSIKNYWDGKEIGGIQNLQVGALDFQELELGVVEIKPDEEYHYLRTQSLTVGKSFIVGIKLRPVD